MSKNKKSIKRILITIDEGIFLKAKMGLFYEERGRRFYQEIDPPKRNNKSVKNKIYSR